MRISILLISLLLSTGCALFSQGFLEPEVQSLADVEAFIGADLPPGAMNVQYEIQGFTDLSIQLRFGAPPDEISAFLGELALELTPGTEPLATASSNDLVWWQPETAQKYAQGQLDNYNVNRFYKAIVDQSDPARWIVYLIVFSQ